MGIDIDAIRRRREELEKKGRNVTSIWKPKPDIPHTIRILPNKTNLDNPFSEVWFHYNLGAPMICLKEQNGERCPICEFVSKLYASQDTDDYQLAGKMRAKMRTYVNMVVRGEEDSGPKLWGFGKKTYNNIMDYILDPEYGDIASVTDGTDVSVEYQSPAAAGNDYGDMLPIKPKRNSSVLHTDSEIAKKLLTDQTDIFDIYKPQDYDSMKDILRTWMENRMGVDASEPDKKPATSNNGEVEETTPDDGNKVGKSDSMMAELDELFAEDKKP